MFETTSSPGSSVQPPIQVDRGFSIDSVVVGRSPRMRAVFDFVRVIADSESNVLIVGETGTGKEMVANLIHHSGRRRRRPFVAVSCAILTETLIESELFGHERGAFTGAIKDRPGRFEMAEGGTIFLDDIDDVPASVQVKLLRVIQQRTVERVGGTRAIPVDVRVITGSKRSLKQLVAEGRFREDLYYRLNVVPIWLPPLRERREDIPLLTDHFVRQFFKERGDASPDLSPDRARGVPALPVARQRPRAGECLRAHRPDLHLQPGPRAAACPRASCSIRRCRRRRRPSSIPLHPAAVSLDDRLQEVESHLITWALKVSHGNKSKAAELLQIKRSTLGDRIRKLGLDHLGSDE